jgi:outer membrane protein assembly factor BamE (lipoprotein component of BamABCDE complex)
MRIGVRRARWTLVAIAALSGCATVGRPFLPENVQQIQNGRTTKGDLVLMFGDPYRRGLDDGDSTWTYLHYKIRMFGEHVRSRDLYIRFDDAGRVKSYSYSSNVK